jgi:hypothetical protein
MTVRPNLSDEVAPFPVWSITLVAYAACLPRSFFGRGLGSSEDLEPYIPVAFANRLVYQKKDSSKS